MNDKMKNIAIIRALAIYNKRGVIRAIKELKSVGYSLEQSLDILAIYDNATDILESCQVDNIAKKQ